MSGARMKAQSSSFQFSPHCTCIPIRHTYPSAAAHSHDNLELVSIFDRRCTELAAGNDLTVALDRKTFSRTAAPIDELSEMQCLLELVALAVNSNCDHACERRYRPP